MEFFKKYFLNLLLVLLVAFVAMTKGPTIYNNFKLKNSKLETVMVESLSGESISFPILGEKKLVLFWMIDCPPCKLEMRRINDLVNQGYASVDQVLAINFVDTKEQVLDYLKAQTFHYSIALDNGGKIAEKFNINTTPTILFLDENGGIDWASSGISPTLSFRIKNFFL